MRVIWPLMALSLLVGCAGPQYTVDDGRKVDEELLAHIRHFGTGEQMLRPAIERSAKLKDAECDTQWELPFSVASSDELPANDRVAWVRALGVDERLTIIGVAPDSGLQVRDKVKSIAGYSRESAEKMLLELVDRRDAGRPFDIQLITEKTIRVTPFKVCRGYARLAPPSTPKIQDYHWLLSVHPLQVAQVKMTEDEALWAVLWGQGLSEEGGARMKAYHYTTKIAGTLYNLFTIATGIQGAALAANAAVKAAQTAAAVAAKDIAKKQLLDQATSAATAKLRDEIVSAAQKMTQKQVVGAMQQAAANRGSLSGVAWVAATAFEKADVWAYDRLQKLNGNALAGFSLHQKLIEQGLTANSLAFDPERMSALSKVVDQQGRSDEVVAILGGIKPEELQFELTAMPTASAAKGFAYDDITESTNDNQPWARGLVDGMLSMSLESASSK